MIKFKKKKFQLPTTGSIKNLGLYFDDRFRFNAHINRVVNKSFKILGFFSHDCTDFSDKNGRDKFTMVNYLVLMKLR